MSLVLSNAFKQLLLSSYVNIKIDFAIKSQHLIGKSHVEIFHDNLFKSLDYLQDKNVEIEILKKRIPKKAKRFVGLFFDDQSIFKLRNGEAVILCQSNSCPYYITVNQHIQLVYSDHLIHYLKGYKVKKSHSHSKQIYKL